jgi:hypothetical protein
MKNIAGRLWIIFLMVGVFLIAESIGGLPVAGAYALGTNGTAPAITTGTVAGYVSQAQQIMNGTSALPVAPSWMTSFLNGIGQWFVSVTAQGTQSTGASILPTGIAGSFFNITTVLRNFLMPFDAWLYGIVHFHIIILFNFVFGVVDWVLGLAASVVTWLNSTFHAAAGR